MARQAALLLLAVHGHDMPDTAVTNDFYRQALDLDLRSKREYADAILSAMGSVDKARFSRIKSLLRLSDEAMELADRYDIDEKKLRYVLPLSMEFHVEIVRQIIDFNLSSKQVKELSEGEGLVSENTDDSFDKIPASAVKMAKITQATNLTSPQDFARALLQQEGDIHLARARLQAMRKLLSEAEKLLVE